MDHSAAPSVLPPGAESDNDPFEMPPIGASDQACKECRRRKARCNRALPTCDLCTKYRRHCLYEKHSRTPLTRKHLTEVEIRLERAEGLVRQMRALIPSHLRTWEKQTSKGTAAAKPSEPNGGFDFASKPATVETASQSDALSALQEGAADDARENDHQKMMESPPLDDFEWAERDPTHTDGLSPERGDGVDDESPISDGMASLSVNEREGGYLGVASGAALLRLLEPKTRRRVLARSNDVHPSMHSITPQPNPNRHVAESMIDAYFRLYHVSYPVIHEPTFRAQYSEVIPRPNGPSWTVLAYVVAAIGVWTSASSSADTLDLALFSQARGILNFHFLETGNLTLVQALTLSANYLQKRDKPNSGYNYLGLVLRMAMGLGLHKEFQGWNISPLKMEIRRRVWWTLCVLDVGASLTFSRPNTWPYQGVEVSVPLNVHDKDLTAASETYPAEVDDITPYTAVATQAHYVLAAHECANKVIARPFPSAEELLRMDATKLEPWLASIPSFFSAEVPPRYALAQAICVWRLWNMRIIMYRPFVIRRALRRGVEQDKACVKAYEKCLADAKATIDGVAEYWGRQEHNRLSAWYGLYFIFQAVLIPCICLRNEPSAAESAEWRTQITTTLSTIRAIAPLQATSGRCHSIILGLCGQFLDEGQVEAVTPIQQQQAQQSQPAQIPTEGMGLDEPWMMMNGQVPVDDSPQTQINSVLSMMWPNVAPMEAADVVMGDDAGWMEFLRGGSVDEWDVAAQGNGDNGQNGL